MIRIGIPRALLYYQYYPMWRTFFEKLGAEVVTSPPTTPAILAGGAARVVADTCLPVKAFLGHVLSLVKKCDFIFIPAIRSMGNHTYSCSKFLGLPDMTRAVIPECPPILDIDIDLNKGKGKLYQAIYQLGQHFAWNPLKIRQSSLATWQAYLDYRGMMSREGLTPTEAIARLAGAPEKENLMSLSPPAPGRANIALIGHPYLLHDEYLNHRIIHRLQQSDSRVLTPEMLTTEEQTSATAKLGSQAYWTYEEDIIGAGGHYLQSKADGVIGLMAFGCGPDSLIMDTVRRQAARLKNTPFMSLTLEEHTAEAGLVTRLEAFLEMIRRKKRNRTETCA